MILRKLRGALPRTGANRASKDWDGLSGVRHITLTWALDIEHGGMTTALLRRSRALAEATGAEVTVLTFDDDRDYREIVAGLSAAGELANGVRVLNIWCWLEGAPGRAGMRTQTRSSADGEQVLQVDHLRSDGTLLVSDQRDADRFGVPGGRRVTLYGADGEPIESWSSIWGLYRYWLDALLGTERAVLVADSKPAATFLTSYRRKRALTAHVIHGSHFEDDGVTVRQSRRAALEKLDKFDLVVALTGRQARDLEQAFSPKNSVAVIPNSIDLPERIDPDRAVGRGMMLASLIERKRVGHAIDALAAVPEASLAIYGDGPERGELEARAGRNVQFLGHVRGAAVELERHSFLLVTSRSEGSPLAIMEALAAGCIPIAYDIPYGPSDLIKDGVTGFLVPDGDVKALSDRIRELAQMPDRRVRRMRRAARTSAEAFCEAEVLAVWGREIAGAWEEKAKRTSQKKNAAPGRMRGAA